MRLEERPNVSVISGESELVRVVADLLSATHRTESIVIDNDDHSYDFTTEQLSILRRADVFIINIPSIRHYSPLLISYLRSLNKIAPMIFLHFYTQKKYAEAFLKMGAAAYLNVNFHTTELLEAIEQVSTGEKYIAETVL